MRIIKADQTRWVDGKWVVDNPLPEPELEVPDEVQAQLAVLLARAQEQAAQLVSQAHADAEAVHEQARQEGLEQGRVEGEEVGFQQGLAQWREAFEQLARESQDFLASRENLLASMEPDLVRLALLVASKILTREVRDAVVVRTLVRSAISKLEGDAVVRVRLNPQDVGRLSNPLQAGPRFEVIGDPAVGAGGCIVETAQGRVDGTFATQFEELARTLLNEDPAQDPALSKAHGALQRPSQPPGRSGFGR